MWALSKGIQQWILLYYLNPLLEKLAKEQKIVFLLGDFNVDLLKYEQHKATNEFLDSLSSNMFLPYIIQPTRITSHSKCIIENIFAAISLRKKLQAATFRKTSQRTKNCLPSW